jgi:hypothetical protein
LSDRFSTRYPQLILTFKTRVKLGERIFIVGWYIPLEGSGSAAGKEAAGLKKRGEQVLFQISETSADSGGPFLINIGKAIRRQDQQRRNTGKLRRRF